jgi:hypothetical protein
LRSPRNSYPPWSSIPSASVFTLETEFVVYHVPSTLDMDLTMYGLINGFPVVARRCRDRTRHAPWMTKRTAIGTLTLRDRAMRFNLSGDMIFYTVGYKKSVAHRRESRIVRRSNHTAASDHGVVLHPQHERHSSVDLELFVDHVQMDLHGAFRDPELVGNLLVAEPARDSPGDL